MIVSNWLKYLAKEMAGERNGVYERSAPCFNFLYTKIQKYVLKG
jgi:hypothetical protein